MRKNKPAHLDIHKIGKFYCKNTFNCCFSNHVWNYRWSGNLLAFSSYFMRVAGIEIQDQIVSVERLFHLHHGCLSCWLEEATSLLQELASWSSEQCGLLIYLCLLT